jgi:hypothetical protein
VHDHAELPGDGRIGEVIELRLIVDDGPAAESLWQWLSDEPELRGHLRRDVRAAPGALGPAVETVVDGLVTGTLGGVIGFLGQALSNWLSLRRRRGQAATEITVLTGNGRQVLLSTDDPAAAAELLRAALEKPE